MNDFENAPMVTKKLTDEFSCPTVFEPNRNTPNNVMDDVRLFWADYEGHNGSYVPFDLENQYIDNSSAFPHLYEYLKSFGVTECLIHYDW